jgi:hypothetical protein
MDGSGNDPVLTFLQEPLRAIGSVILPSPEALDDQGWREAERIIERALAPKPWGVKLQIRLFLKAVNLFPLATTGRTLVNLPLDRRAAFLGRLHRSPVMPLRRGLWGIRTLILMGYYNQKRIREGIGYAAHPRGWMAYFGHEQKEKEETEKSDGGAG